MLITPRSLMLMAATALVLGCAAGSPADRSSDATPRRSDRYVLTGDDLRATGAATVFDALRQLRPTWLDPQASSVRQGLIAAGGASVGGGESNRPGQGATTGVATLEPLVSVNGMSVGGVAALRTVSLEGVTSVRFVEGAEASRRLGPRAAAGLIEVVRQR